MSILLTLEIVLAESAALGHSTFMAPHNSSLDVKHDET